ncbi:MAG: Na+/H+ antiporter subunit D [Myxococcales bacterium]|nr:Na+/H+ antiporter subunit D [Myxococcales bacterium]
MSSLVLTPVLVPLGTALLTAALVGQPRAQRLTALLGTGALLGCAGALLREVQRMGPVRTHLGAWPAPFGIELVADGLGAAMVLLMAIVGAVTLLFQQSCADPAPARPGLLPLFSVLLAGVGGTFVTGDLFNLYVWFEVLLLAALGLLALGGQVRQLDATLKYFVLNTLGTLLLLVGIGYLYAATGHLNFGALREAAGRGEAASWLPFLVVPLLAFLVKAGAFPLFAWLPASYHTLPGPLLALFAGLLTKVGVYAILRTLSDVFAASPRVIYECVGWLAVPTMIVGALGAAYHWDLRRILAFHVISQIGYLLLGVGLGTMAGASATVFYLGHNVLAKTNLVLIAAIVFRLGGSYDLRRCGGLYKARPLLAVMFLISAFAMVGAPPLSGFWAKLMLIRETLLLERGVWAAAALTTGFLTLYSMSKIWLEAFWKERPPRDESHGSEAGHALERPEGLGCAYAAVGILAGLTVALGLFPEPVVSFLDRSAGQLGVARVHPSPGFGGAP